MSTASLQVVQLSYRHRQSPVDGPICGRGSRQARRHGFRRRSPHPLSTPLVYRTEKDGTKQRDFGKARSSSRVFLPALMTAHVLQPRPRPGRRRTHTPLHGTPKEEAKEEEDNPYFASVGIAAPIAAKPSSPPLPRPRPASPSRQSPSRQNPARQSPARLSPRQLRSGGGSGPAKPPTSRAPARSKRSFVPGSPTPPPQGAPGGSAGGVHSHGRRQSTGRSATASGARASRLQSRQSHCL